MPAFDTRIDNVGLPSFLLFCCLVFVAVFFSFYSFLSFFFRAAYRVVGSSNGLDPGKDGLFWESRGQRGGGLERGFRVLGRRMRRWQEEPDSAVVYRGRE